MTDQKRQPMMVMLVGPPAVGKMTVGHALAARTGLKLFHNHHTIELVLRFFDYDTAPFWKLVSEFRTRVLEEIAASDSAGAIFTYVWAFNNPRDHEAVERFAKIFRDRGGRVVIVELEASQGERLRRNTSEFRIAEKPSMRDVVASSARLLELDAAHQLSSNGMLDHRADYFRLNIEELSPSDAAGRIIERFDLFK